MIFDMPSCGGCRTCEMACSFKHRGEFVPSISSIRILDKEDGIGYSVVIVDKDDGRVIACDGCDKLGLPLCLQYCKEREDLRMILDTFMKEKKRRAKE